jgi:outer membrane biosynthesis protein TonB
MVRNSALRNNALLICGSLALLLTSAAANVRAQQASQALSLAAASQPVDTPAPASTANIQPAAQTPSSTATSQPAAPSASAPAPASVSAATENPPAQTPAAAPRSADRATEPGCITEDELRKQLVGKDLFLRAGYLDNALSFNEHGMLIGHSPQGSYTLAGIRIEKVRLLKHKVELTGARYALHFLGALPSEDPTTAVDRVNITPKKKEVRITIDRELVVKPKQQTKKEKNAKPVPAATSPAVAVAGNSAPSLAPGPAPSLAPGPAPSPAPSLAPSLTMAPAANLEPTDLAPADAQEAQKEMAAAPEAERPADAKSVTTTLSPAHANQVLEGALGNIFAPGFDERMMASMPGFWKLYYDAVAARGDYQPADPNVLRQNTVDKRAQLKSTFEPGSNQFAQDYGVAGMSEYHVVVGADGKPGEIVVARPIGFGLDESAVDSIRKVTFEPAVKDGKPVPVMLNMVVEFRIYSKRTEVESKPAPEEASAAPMLPGPYSVQH